MIQLEARPKDKRVLLMATCLCDAFFDDVAKATVEVLEHLGCEIIFPEDQTCCGQPAFNSGDWTAARKVINHTTKVFAGKEPVIVPSGSCAAMVFHGSPMACENESNKGEVDALANRTWELADFIVNGLGVTTWSGKFKAKVALHRACHTRGTQTIPAAESLLGSIDGLELLPYGETEQCCGFGGTFSVTFPHLSKEMGTLKIEHLLENRPDYIVSPDMSCLMHQKGLANKMGKPFEIRHIAQILRDALKEGGKN